MPFDSFQVTAVLMNLRKIYRHSPLLIKGDELRELSCKDRH